MKLRNLYLIIFFLFFCRIEAQVRLPRLISDGMILQRETGIKIWGWAAPEEKISLFFLDREYHTTADSAGNWHINLPELKAGGPYDMKITGSNTIGIKNILVGDVWVCSGQSNMELPMNRVSWVYPDDIEGSENPDIRQFYVPREYNFNEPQKDIKSGSWVSADPRTILSFSATAYFFAKELNNRYHIPIGIINTALGGSPAEAWISEESLKKFPGYYNELQRCKDSNYIKNIEDADKKRTREWYSLLNSKDEAYRDPEGVWYKPGLNTSQWKTMQVPGYWEDAGEEKINGVLWFRKNFSLDAADAGKEAKLILGRIIDADSVFVNGVFVGTTGYQYPPRRYTIPAGVLKEGENNITVRLISNQGKGGFVPDKPYLIEIAENKIDLKGEWKYKIGAVMEPLAGETFFRYKPGGLFNAMISPLLNYSIKGFVWYQGESNAGRSSDYFSLMSTLIGDWRDSWKNENLPFIFAQLPNYMEPVSQPSESDWALLREAQLKTLTVPNTAMAVTIDLGEWNDIHPLNKKDVGYRLALAAEKTAYGDQVVYSGPLFQSMTVKGNRIILTFSDTGTGLTARGGGELKGFAVAGADKNYVWAKARINGDKVVVWSKDIQKPVSVRYAWSDNPADANLYNKEGLPASPFRAGE